MNNSKQITLVNPLYNIHSIWMVMMALTLITYTMGKLGYGGVAATLFLLLTAAIKATFIMRDYMGLRGVSLLWRIIMYGWLLIVCVAIAITYIISL